MMLSEKGFVRECREFNFKEDEDTKIFFSIFFIPAVILLTIWIKCAYLIILAFPFLAYLSVCIDKKIAKEHFLRVTEMNVEEVTRFYNFLEEFGLYATSLLHDVCKLNTEARERQIEVIKELFNLNESIIVKYILDKKESEENEDWRSANLTISSDLSVTKRFVDRLFKLTILEDGIHNDEWKLLREIMGKLKFNNRYFNYYKERYNPLRTEFDESEWKEKSSTITYTLASPKEYYDVLGLKEGASYEEIRRAYHDLALQHHPDLPKNAGRTEECEKMMMKINEAYEKLRVKN